MVEINDSDHQSYMKLCNGFSDWIVNHSQVYIHTQVWNILHLAMNLQLLSWHVCRLWVGP